MAHPDLPRADPGRPTDPGLSTASALADAERRAQVADIARSRRVQTIGAWCGPVFAVCLFGGWGLMAGFIPLISAHDTPRQVVAAWSHHRIVTLIGLTIAMIGISLLVPFYLSISTQMRRTERRVPYLAMLQFASGLIIVCVLIIPMLIFIVGAFRPQRDPQIDVLVNDASYIMLILPWPPIMIELFAMAYATLGDQHRRGPGDQARTPVFPRWYAYLDIVAAFLLVPANMIIFVKSGPFSWDGAIGFWLPAAVFGVWYFVTTYVLLAAIKQEEAADLAALEARA